MNYILITVFICFNTIQTSLQAQPLWLSADISKVICDQKSTFDTSKSVPPPVKSKPAHNLCSWFEKCKGQGCDSAFKYQKCDGEGGSQSKTGNSGSQQVRIVNGVTARPYKYPSIVLMKIDGAHACSGTIINQYWVMSAAHCLVHSSPSYFKFVAGEHDKDAEEGPEQHVKAVQIVKHKHYDTETQENDIALFKVSPGFEFNDKVSPVNLPEKDFFETGTAWAVGWGATKEDGYAAQILQEVDLPIMTNEKCKQIYKHDYIGPKMLCAGYDSGEKDACQGDSGGPLYYNKGTTMIQVGVVSWGRGCARKNSPGVYTMVSKYLDWIKTTTEG